MAVPCLNCVLGLSSFQGLRAGSPGLLEAEARRKFVLRLSREDKAKPWLQDRVPQQGLICRMVSPRKLQEGVSALAGTARGQEPSPHPTCKGPVKRSAAAPAPTWGRGALLATS